MGIGVGTEGMVQGRGIAVGIDETSVKDGAGAGVVGGPSVGTKKIPSAILWDAVAQSSDMTQGDGMAHRLANLPFEVHWRRSSVKNSTSRL
ncbi:hypothetical protein SARC_08774 [Sphaeroforma arctica JP610]|uniref:Uncharacterized protein n=1 Tax=Sphaeroforma arctica JP610 TaxID=667725 RepID=A0A0L0FPR7_9EUKA|nr:hypothetical protein SARC_08774 [Sphaeroforma arctica JP610]KNC78805.1 hypothetical protein SARC_08774 [Sphaeroforma arctica JP610]|eukprot:XP_014152707.1 hypothetical protein SARC_08774 [Sphaeroforma arctica JP610]